MYLIQPLLEPWSGKKALGNGGHSTVFSAEMPSVENKSSASSLPSGGDASRAMTRVVVKCIARKDERQTVVENEVQILMHLWPHSDRHIVPYRAAFHDADNYYIVMQHLPGTTSLTDHLDADDAIPLPALLDSLPHDSPVIAQKLRTLHVIAVDLMLGLERIHAANVAHRGISLSFSLSLSLSLSLFSISFFFQHAFTSVFIQYRLFVRLVFSRSAQFIITFIRVCVCVCVCEQRYKASKCGDQG
jgi:serine/threonine protein kinase